MALEIETDEMVKRGKQVADYFQINFEERIGMMLVLFNKDSSSYHMMGSGRMILEQTFALMFQVLRKTIDEVGAEASMVAIAETMEKISPGMGGALITEMFARNKDLLNTLKGR